jgi:23S rRNA (pseudouridine1915-N3)-methyltransferase
MLERILTESKILAMRIQIIVAGKPALAYSKTAIDEYLKRLSRHGSYDLVIIKAGDSESVSKRLLSSSENCYRIALDERGQRLTTRELTQTFTSLEMKGTSKTTFLIGAADGHTPELRNASDMILSLSSLTMQHELALVVLLEQLYRIATIKSGSPYHRD